MYFENAMEKEFYYRLQSQTVDWLRFPLIVLVMLIHVDHYSLMSLNASHAAYGIYFFFSQILSRRAVPTFFLFSGYFFFFVKNSADGFTPAVYKQKLRSRIKTLLIPYLFWNLLMLVLKIAAAKGVNGEILSQIKGFPFPPAIQFWYICDLMIFALVSPVLYVLIRKFKSYFVFLLGLLWLSDSGFWADNSLFFFCLGAYFSVTNKNMVEQVRKLKFWPVIAFALLLIADTAVNIAPYKSVHTASNNTYLHCLCIFAGVVSVLYLTSLMIERRRIAANPVLKSSLFFLFAAHPPVIVYAFTRPLIKFVPDNSLGFLIMYVFPVVACTAFLTGLFTLMKKKCPAFLSFICGGRI